MAGATLKRPQLAQLGGDTDFDGFSELIKSFVACSGATRSEMLNGAVARGLSMGAWALADLGAGHKKTVARFD